MAKALVRAIGVFGRYSRASDEYSDNIPEGPTDFFVQRAYGNVANFLKTKGKAVVSQQIMPLPHLDDGIISGPNAAAGYLFNRCIIANCFESGNGFN